MGRKFCCYGNRYLIHVCISRQRLDTVCLYEVYAFRLTNGLAMGQYSMDVTIFTDPSFKCFWLSSEVL